jgi:phosphoribosylaminoimidazolecarboxamide formyltransferase/IMP cyclohydrolase
MAVKTLHPKVHGGILGRRDLPEHVAKMAEYDIGNIDLVCVNLYPFEATIANPDCVLEDAIENIDIGGPTMVRSAAKNWAHVAIVTDAADYAALTAELKANDGKLAKTTRFELAKKAFTHTAAYDGAISNYLTSLADGVVSGKPERVAFPNRLNAQFVKVQDMRYGENPHQSAAFYRDLDPAAGTISATASCRARNCPTTTSLTPMPPGKRSRPSTKPPASSSSMPTPAAWPWPVTP